MAVKVLVKDGKLATYGGKAVQVEITESPVRETKVLVKDGKIATYDGRAVKV